jgi:hypothetical protein
MKTYQIKISLNGSIPKIWRRLLVPSDLLLPDFHTLIQISMGWENDHLYQFVKGKTFYSPDDGISDELIDVEYEDTKISDLLKKEKDKIIYEYDFGDGWVHDIILEKTLSDDKLKNPICIDGKMACPPEDCGGIWGYANMLNVLKQPRHQDYEDFLSWIGTDFDPSDFDKDAVNKIFKRLKFNHS